MVTEVLFTPALHEQAPIDLRDVHLAAGAPLPFLLVSQFLKHQISLPLLVIPKLP